ncbi:MAG: hypothetical protein Q8O53_00195, partial [Candidatus Moranbacteria bacterium]|nr:hypothetical protein [Candidatus Moranbacteria bacterium]
MRILFRKKNKIVGSAFLALQLLVSSALPASAGLFGGPKIPTAASVLSAVEQRYHLDVGSIQNQGEMLNVADGKKPTPEVTLFFSPSDPRPLEKVTAKAFPMYFSNNETDLYYTWYVKHVGCDLKNNVNAATQDLCDRDSDNDITVEDWKIEAARILAQDGFDQADADYSQDSDNDAYHARSGGDNKVNTPDHCFINDSVSGKNYELVSAGATISFTCPAGQTAVCMEGEGQVDANTVDFTSSGSAFSFSDTGVCHLAGTPACSAGGVASCNTGSPRCVTNPNGTDCGNALAACTNSNVVAAPQPFCQHLFPNATGHKTAQGEGANGAAFTFGADEEEFWGTNPTDPDTADNGNKDEANIAGLGQSSFTWNYASGDQVGVAIEGTTMIPTKYGDSSAMIMWALAKNDCPVTGKGSFFKTVKGYSVAMDMAKMDINDCLERNLVDPTEGGQAKNLEVSVVATPDNPTNDATEDAAGDMVVAQASVSNASRGTNDTLFDWEVMISNNAQFSNSGRNVTAVVTADLQDLKLLGNTKGLALGTLRLKMDMKSSDLLGGRLFRNYLTGGIGYLKFTARASENFSSGIVRKGKSDVIMQFTSTDKKISAYKAAARLAGTEMRVGLPNPLASGIICNDRSLYRVACRVTKNEIIGLRIDPAGLSSFRWTINGAALACTKAGVSSDCGETEQNHVNFFPVSGDVGDTYTVALTASDILTGNTVTLTRSFHIVAPTMIIVSDDSATAWPKYLG